MRSTDVNEVFYYKTFLYILWRDSMLPEEVQEAKKYFFESAAVALKDFAVRIKARYVQLASLLQIYRCDFTSIHQELR